MKPESFRQYGNFQSVEQALCVFHGDADAYVAHMETNADVERVSDAEDSRRLRNARPQETDPWWQVAPEENLDTALVAGVLVELALLYAG